MTSARRARDGADPRDRGGRVGRRVSGARAPDGAAAGDPRCRRDRGSTTLETVIVFPAILILIFGAFQLGFWYHARSISLAAAQEAARAGAVYGAGAADAYAAGESFLDRAGRGLMESSAIEVTLSADEITVTVTGQALSLIPGWPVIVVQTARLPVERQT
jgi:hypothetical protein